MRTRILVVDDSEDVREILAAKLEHVGYDVLTAESAEDALGRVSSFEPNLIITDVRMPGMGGLALIERVRASIPEIDFIVITGHEGMESTVGAMKMGAFEYLVKPVELDQLEKIVRRCLEDRARKGEISIGSDRSTRKKAAVVGNNPHMIDVYKMVGVLAHNRATVLVRGETGSGKEMIARAIHEHSIYSTEPFLAVNCTALTDSLLASELFGHVKGAFTGATSNRKGFFQLAGAGTIFLDEIGDTTPEFQSKLLRVLQERIFYPVGGEHPIETEARVIAATHQPVEKLVERGAFRRDLYFRLKVIEIAIPPLRERRDDIPMLAEHLLQQIGEKVGVDITHVSSEAMARLREYDWPGNVRELENVLTRATVLARGGSIDSDHLALGMETLPAGNGATTVPDLPRELDAAMLAHVLRVLEDEGGNRAAAARALGISRLRLSWILRKADQAGAAVDARGARTRKDTSDKSLPGTVV